MLSKHAFQLGLVQEHLEECGFLMEQVEYLRNEPWGFYADGNPFEARFLSHFDGLIAVGRLAVEPCLQGTQSSDWGEIATAIMVLESLKDSEIIHKLLIELSEDEDCLKALFFAWLHQQPCEGWLARWDFLQKSRPALLAALVKAGCWRREPTVMNRLFSLQASSDEHDYWIEARGRAKAHLIKPIDEERSAIHGEASLLKGDRATLNWLREEPSHLLLLALAGNRNDVEAYMQLADNHETSIWGILGVGFMGLPQSVPWLIKRLESAEQSAIADLALQLIAGPRTDEPVSDQSLSEFWQMRLNNSKEQLDGQVRLRCGTAWGFEAIVDQLAQPVFPNLIDRWFSLEMSIRFGVDTGIEWELWSQAHNLQFNRWHASQNQPQTCGLFPLAGRSNQ